MKSVILYQLKGRDENLEKQFCDSQEQKLFTTLARAKCLFIWQQNLFHSHLVVHD